MSQDVKIIGGIAIATVVILIVGAFFLSNGSSPSSSSSSASLFDPNKVSTSKLWPAGSYQSNPKGAKVNIVEFGDFQCPACGAMYPVVQQLQKKFGSKLNLIFRNFPLTSLHKNAMLAAQTAVAAGNQGKFWPMYDLLYQNQSTWGDDSDADAKATFTNYAKQLKLNMDKFNQDWTAKATIQKVQSDMADGNSLQVTGTPTFYINQQKYIGPYTFDGLQKAISSVINK